MSDEHFRAGLLCSYPQPSHSGTETAHGSLHVLLEWLANQDITLSPKLKITSVGSDDDPTDAAGDLGVVASESLDRLDEVLAAIPKTALLSKRTSPLAEHDRFQPFCNAVHRSRHPQPDVLILSTVLACELPAASESRWHGYLQSLPGAGTLDLPAFWPDSTARRWLRGTDVEALLQTQGSDSASLQAVFDHYIQPFLANAVPGAARWTIFVHAYALVSSRAFWVDNYHALAMVPLADIFNHHFTSNTCLQSDDIVCSFCGSLDACPHDSSDAERAVELVTQDRQTRCATAQLVEMVLTTPVQAGHQVYNTYGPLSNAKLLANYGFMLDANDDDKLCWFSAGEALRSAGIENCPDDWRRLCVVFIKVQQSFDDDRIAAAEPTDSIMHGSPPDLLYIDADGSISCTLWALLSIAGDDEGGQDRDGQIVERVLRLCGYRISSLAANDLPIDELWDLATRPGTDRRTAMAIRRNIDERTLLVACQSQWEQQD